MNYSVAALVLIGADPQLASRLREAQPACRVLVSESQEEGELESWLLESRRPGELRPLLIGIGETGKCVAGIARRFPEALTAVAEISSDQIDFLPDWIDERIADAFLADPQFRTEA